MSDSLYQFTETNLSDDLKDLVYKSISLFEAFEYYEPFMLIDNAISLESYMEPSERVDSVVNEITKSLDYILRQHCFTVTNCNLRDYNTILDALFRFQHLDNYISIESIVESETDPIDLLSLVLEELTEHDQAYFLDRIVSVQERCVKHLKVFVQNKTPKPVYELNQTPRTDRLKCLFEITKLPSVAEVMVESGMLMGLPLELYLPYCEDYLEETDDDLKTINNILSVIYISNVEDGAVYNSYKELATRYVSRQDKLLKLDNDALKIIGEVVILLKVKDEQTRLSKTGN